MSADEIRRLKQQQDANSIAIQRMQMQNAAQNARRQDDDFDDDLPQLPSQHKMPPQYQHPQQGQQQSYQQVDQNQMILDQIAASAAQKATQQVQANMNAFKSVETSVKTRMDRLINNYPALQQEDSHLTIKARDNYARITKENPTLDEATKYELAVNEAASAIGARPVTSPIEDYASSDYVMPSTYNPAVGKKQSKKSRLTTNIVANAKLMGINVDSATPEGKKNLEELSHYTERFNADANEEAYKYR